MDINALDSVCCCSTCHTYTLPPPKTHPPCGARAAPPPDASTDSGSVLCRRRSAGLSSGYLDGWFGEQLPVGWLVVRGDGIEGWGLGGGGSTVVPALLGVVQLLVTLVWTPPSWTETERQWDRGQGKEGFALQNKIILSHFTFAAL